MNTKSVRPGYDRFFTRATLDAATGQGLIPRDWQRELAAEVMCRNRLIRIPTGFGKTLGVLLAWLWHRVDREDDGWPRRLIICLPMRVLVEQTRDEISSILRSLGRLWDGHSDHQGMVGVHVLMGGVDDDSQWYLYPEHCAVLVCTQDLALSGALNRGYTVPRARWPVEFGLLNHDALWVMDEVQLMDVGMATSAQLQAFRDDDRARGRSLRPCCTWWMSATLQPAWLRASPDTTTLVSDLPESRIPAVQRKGHLWDDVSKPCSLEAVEDERSLAEIGLRLHLEGRTHEDGLTLVVVNTVERAVKVFELLRKDRKLAQSGVNIHLAHSRFRPAERERWRAAFLNQAACAPGTNSIVVSTQVIEAGVDISASRLLTELAPWSSLVQRFGRCARWGGVAEVCVADFEHGDDTKAAPYTKDTLDAARGALGHFRDVAPVHLEAFEDAHPELLERLYPYEPRHLLLRHELDELFDTTPDLSGSDIDISRFIRSGDERDVRVFWIDVDSGQWPSDDVVAARAALCAVPFLRAREWLFDGKGDRLKAGKRAWIWDWVNGRWTRPAQRDVFPGRTLLVASDSGGYDERIGWNPGSAVRVAPAESPSPANGAPEAECADGREQHEGLSVLPPGGGPDGAGAWQTIAVHGREVGTFAQALARALAPVYAELFGLAGRWHDVGKAHECFNRSIIDPPHGGPRPNRQDLAKAPKDAWLPPNRLYSMLDGSRRAGFRHELASTLALFDVLRRRAPDHPALLGPWRQFLQQAGFVLECSPPPAAEATAVEQEVLGLDAQEFNLVAYLVCSHHGKVRVAWHSSAHDQSAHSGSACVRGVRQDDVLPSIVLATSTGEFVTIPESSLTLAPAAAGLNPVCGMGWTERVIELLNRFGPFTLAWLEALLVAADRRVSRRTDTRDPLLDPAPVLEASR